MVSLQEFVREVKSKSLGEFSRNWTLTYDRVCWSFLREVLLRQGFATKWVHLAMVLVLGGQTAITINGKVGNSSVVCG